MTEKPVAIILPTWNPQEPRFTIKECERCSDDRVFKNNQCVFNQRLGFAYSVEEIVEVLNALGKENEQLKKQLAEIKETCNKNRIPNHLTTHIPFNCEHRHSCLENHSENAVSMGKSKIAKEILKLIDGGME